MKTTRKAMAMMILGSATLLGAMAQVAKAGPDIRLSYSSAGHGYGYSTTAGILVIDGQRITIRAGRNIGNQIVRAFRRCGYDASIHHGKVKVYFDGRHGPRVSWYKRGYRASIYRDHGQMTLSWYESYRSGRSYGKGHSDGYWGDRYHRDRRYQPRRRARRGGCD